MTPQCTEAIAEKLTELCQRLVARAGHQEAYDTEPRVAFQRLFRGAPLRRPEQFEMYTPEGNAACVQAYQLILGHPELVNLFGLNQELYDRLKAPAP